MISKPCVSEGACKSAHCKKSVAFLLACFIPALFLITLLGWGKEEKNPSPLRHINIEAWASWTVDIKDRYGHGDPMYSLYLEIGNPSESPIYFDAIALRFLRSDIEKWGDEVVTETRIVFTEDGTVQLFSYGKEKVREAPAKDKPLKEQRLGGYAAMVSPDYLSGVIVPSEPGYEPTVMSVILLHKGKEVCSPQFCVLPPLFRIPASRRLAEGEKGFHMEFLSTTKLPTRSDITNIELVGRIFNNARAISPDAVLTKVWPIWIKTDFYPGGRILYTAEVWQYGFWSPKGYFSIYKDDPQKIEWDTEASRKKPTNWLTLDHIKGAKIDSDVAVLMAEIAGAKATKDGPFQLEAIHIGGRVSPVWFLPYEIASQKIGILANTGEVVLRKSKGEGYELVKDCIWNK